MYICFKYQTIMPPVTLTKPCLARGLCSTWGAAPGSGCTLASSSTAPILQHPQCPCLLTPPRYRPAVAVLSQVEHLKGPGSPPKHPQRGFGLAPLLGLTLKVASASLHAALTLRFSSLETITHSTLFNRDAVDLIRHWLYTISKDIQLQHWYGVDHRAAKLQRHSFPNQLAFSITARWPIGSPSSA